jgi:hypothetical protein
MRPTLVPIEDVADLGNLHRAFWRAARGHRHRPEVAAYERALERELAELASALLAERVPLGEFHRFTIHDPKRRTIHAPPFCERVLHHALLGPIEPVLERALVADTFACRAGKGSLAAVHRAQQHLRRFPWYVKVDVRRYFDSIDHDILLALLRRRIRGGAVLRLCARIIGSYHTAPGRGLPIGALPSQHFANLYLGPLDRLLADSPRVEAQVRYMDDVAWWCASREAARSTLAEIRAFLGDVLRLQLKDSVQLQPSERGLSLCGFRISRGALRLSGRRRRRYAEARRRWERAFAAGAIDAAGLQRGYAAALAVTAHAAAATWRREQLARVSPPEA